MRSQGKDPVEYVREQYAHVWQEVQQEVLLLLAELLRTSLRGLAGAADTAAGSSR
jgi:hypothetical protein